MSKCSRRTVTLTIYLSVASCTSYKQQTLKHDLEMWILTDGPGVLSRAVNCRWHCQKVLRTTWKRNRYFLNKEISSNYPKECKESGKHKSSLIRPNKEANVGVCSAYRLQKSPFPLIQSKHNPSISKYKGVSSIWKRLHFRGSKMSEWFGRQRKSSKSYALKKQYCGCCQQLTTVKYIHNSNK